MGVKVRGRAGGQRAGRAVSGWPDRGDVRRVVRS